jgi:hypothetical protein
MRDPARPNARSHITAKVADKYGRCHWEYRRLPDFWRIVYWVDTDARLIEIVYVGRHP